MFDTIFFLLFALFYDFFILYFNKIVVLPHFLSEFTIKNMVESKFDKHKELIKDFHKLEVNNIYIK